MVHFHTKFVTCVFHFVQYKPLESSQWKILSYDVCAKATLKVNLHLVLLCVLPPIRLLEHHKRQTVSSIFKSDRPPIAHNSYKWSHSIFSECGEIFVSKRHYIIILLGWCTRVTTKIAPAKSERHSIVWKQNYSLVLQHTAFAPHLYFWPFQMCFILK